jgi:hypothetical protein
MTTLIVSCGLTRFCCAVMGRAATAAAIRVKADLSLLMVNSWTLCFRAVPVSFAGEWVLGKSYGTIGL